MRYWLTAIIVIFIVMLGACQTDTERNGNPAEMNAEDLPDVRAFQDEFTKSFLQSTEEIREDYYHFLSGTGAYEMDFPAGGIVGEKGYSLKQKEYEAYLIGVEEGNGLESSIKVDYYSKLGTSEVELDMLSSQFNQKLDFKKYLTKDNTIFIAEFDDDEKSYGSVALVEHKNRDRGITIIYETECVKSSEDCSVLKKEKQEEIKKWINSIEFVKKK